jgi:hypothetical protein
VTRLALDVLSGMTGNTGLVGIENGEILGG